MSAAAARRRKQLAARASAENQDLVAQQLEKILAQEADMDEATAYEALQLAQSQVRKKVNRAEFASACDLAYSTSLNLLKKNRVSVASQLLALLVQVLRETHTEETETWIARLVELQEAHSQAMEASSGSMPDQEANRLHRLQCDWLRACASWSSDLGTVKYGHNQLQQMLGEQCWKLSLMETDEEEVMDLKCDAVQHMVCAEQPNMIVTWLETLPAPTDEETAQGHTCPPALRDALLTRALLLCCALENLRDANILIKAFIEKVENRDVKELSASYTNKEDGKAPSHVIFGSMLLRVCEKDSRTGPLFSWLLRSFKRELDRLHKPQVALGYTTKIGKSYFNIQPPPSMLNMVENMMGMMGGGGMGGGMNPAMMQAAMAQMQQGGMM
ncbi:predicted protein [Phaeodactylum tricornutum CCAP 1055/1]|jgi:hypothetical protein|uniref:Uncharacterized protein n=1 Tax=Phaeodactylum tricornutum (strain CCAP 1055/1) TaxID=556484 RepID=B7FTS5_PHATC|nr:predicted protein [Phaeodactylum tricornutum CCAP 1055/1]EEC49864.1 predicted protein [Phaeodactylum tricornutum CCAP 1055/1]|eukprot:XP_002178199.1 predicted protein [Phaeodactylum tricornutum CCAP 1055/1]